MTIPPDIATHPVPRADAVRGDAGSALAPPHIGREPVPSPAVEVARASWRVDVSERVPLPGRFEIAVDVIAPAQPRANAPRVVLACLPGGFLSRRYFDLSLDPDADPHAGDRAGAAVEAPGKTGAPLDRRFSFAEAMAQQGFVSLAFDHLGVGDSSKPERIEDGYALGVEEIAGANQHALEVALARLALGDPSSGIPATPNPQLFGVGHSMGSSLCVEQQARAGAFRGLILFSFTTRGVPRFLDATQREFADDPARARAALGRLTRQSMGSPYPERATNSEAGRVAAFGVGTAPPIAEEALHRAATNLLGTAGLLAMLPGGYAPSAEHVGVPTLIVLGDHDLHDDAGLAEMLPRSPRVSTFVLEDCWHCHFVANRRQQLFAHVAEWILAELAFAKRVPARSTEANPLHRD